MSAQPFLYQQTGGYFAQVAENLEALAASELAELGAERVNPVYRGIYFSAEPETLYRVCFQSRLCTRVLAPLRHFNCHSTKYLYKTAMDIPWGELFAPGQTFVVNANVSDSKSRHSQYAALCLKDAVVDRLRDETGSRPSVDKQKPDLVLNLHIHKNQAMISLDASGSSLHRRGYRQETVSAPIQETLAAAIIAFSEWDGTRPLVDPFCGSGTLLCEAMMRVCRIPAGALRGDFGFLRFPDFDPAAWQRVREEGERQRVPLPSGLLVGSDADKLAVRAARINLGTLPFGKEVPVKRARFQELEGISDSVIVANPPYGVRLGAREEAAALVGELGSFLKHRCTGSSAFLYFGDRELLKKIGLRPRWKKSLSNGGLDGVLARYDMY